MTTLQSSAKFPMRAIGPVTIAGVQYAAGSPFDALTKENRDYLVKHESAEDDPNQSPTETRVIEGYDPEQDGLENADEENPAEDKPSGTRTTGTKNERQDTGNKGSGKR